MWRNDWSTLTVPALGQWRPTRSVSVVIPAYNSQASLDLTLAALTGQTYPADLLEVVVVDDGSTPPIDLPAIRPVNTRVVPTGQGWGSGAARDWGARHSDGEIIMWLDADMVPFAEHVEAQLRWHEAVGYAVTLGYKRMVDIAPGDPGWPDPATVAAAVADGSIDRLFPVEQTTRHEYVEELIDSYQGLRRADHVGFLAFVTATATLPRALYLEAGGLDRTLRLGEDTEFGFRLAQAGAAFVPEPAARSWHLGRTHVMRQVDQVRRYNKPFLADLMPHPRWLRKGGGTAWSVPLVTVEIPADGPLERVRAAVDSVLASDERDLQVRLVGAWSTLTDDRRSILSDPRLDLRLIGATYRGDPRVRLVEPGEAEATASPFRLSLPAGVGLAPEALGTLLAVADSTQAGRVRVSGVGGSLERTAAVSRAARAGASVEAVWGEHTVPATEIGVVDLSGFTVAQLAAGVGAVRGGAYRSGRWLPGSVEVAGVRSLGQAGVVVARIASRKALSRLKRAVRKT